MYVLYDVFQLPNLRLALYDVLIPFYPQNWSMEVLGGGRISYDSSKKEVRIYGYSVQYGQPQHSVSAELYRAAFPDCTVSWSNDGY